MTDSPRAPERPSAGPSRPYQFPGFTRRTLPNGVCAIVANVARVPLVSLHAVVKRGAIHERVEDAGLSLLMARALMEGTQVMNGADLAERFEILGGGLDAEVSWDALEWSTTTRAASAESAVKLLASILREPAFREADVERLRGERLAELVEQRAEPRGLADDAFSACVYRAGSRLALPVGGDTSQVSRLTAERVREWHRRMVAPRFTTIIVVGDIAEDDALDIVSRTLGDWRVGAEVEARPTKSEPEVEQGIHLVIRPGAEQTELRMGHAGPPRRAPEYFDIVVMNAILGGLFSSRINLNLRERHGYTYGASSAFEWRRDGSTVGISTAVRLDATVPSIREIVSEVERMREKGVSDVELSLAVDYLEGVFPIRYETTTAIAGALATMVEFELPEDYFDRYRVSIRGVTKESVLRAAQEFLAPGRLRIALVSDPSIAGELDSLDAGEVTVITPDEGEA